MSIAEKLQIIAENEQKVFEAGRNSAVDPDKIIKAIATGVDSIYLDDVSEVKHDVKVKTIAGAKVKVTGKNILPYPYRYSTGNTIHDVTFTDNGDGTITAKGTSTGNCQYDLLNTEIEVVEDLKLSGCPTGGSAETYCLEAVCRTPEGKYVYPIDFGNSATIIKGYTITRLFIMVKPAAGTVDFVFKPQLEKNTRQTSYEPYNSAEYTADTNGNVTVVSRSPIMEITSDGELSVEYHRSFGIQTEYDRFWDALQGNGDGAIDYRYRFFYWSNDAYNPKYPIYSTKSSMQSCFQNARILDTLVDIDLSKTVNAQSFFASCSYMHTIRKLIVAETTNLSGIFQSCPALENVTVEGTIGSNGVNLQWSTKLSHESLMSIINCLQDKTSDTSGTEWIVTLGEVNIAKLTDEEKQIAWSKGWVLG